MKLLSMKKIKRQIPVLIAFLLASITAVSAQSQPLEISGTIQEISQKESWINISKAASDAEGEMLYFNADTQVTKQITAKEIKAGDFVGIIFEESEGEKMILSAVVGTKEQIEKGFSPDQFPQFAPPVGEAQVPVEPEQPELPPLPPAPEGQAPPAGGGEQQGGGAPGEEATGFSPEEAAKAKAEKEGKHPLDDILHEEGPLSAAAGADQAVMPSFFSGKVLAVEAVEKIATLTAENEKGEKFSFDIEAYGQVLNRFYEISRLKKGSRVTAVYDLMDGKNRAFSIVLAPDEAAAAEKIPA